jgi:hypothetical protein
VLCGVIIMRKAIEIYKEAENEVISGGNQSCNSIAITSIEKTQKEMFYYLYEQAELEENKQLSLIDFFDKMDRALVFS